MAGTLPTCTSAKLQVTSCLLLVNAEPTVQRSRETVHKHPDGLSLGGRCVRACACTHPREAVHQVLGRQRPDPPEAYTLTGQADAHQQSDGTSPPVPSFELPRMSFRGTITPLSPNPKLSRVVDSSSFFTPHVQPITKSHSFCLPHCAEPRPLSTSR